MKTNSEHNIHQINEQNGTIIETHKHQQRAMSKIPLMQVVSKKFRVEDL